MNVALGAKLDWRLKAQPNSSWVQILKAKYLQSAETEHQSKQCSPIWKLLSSTSFFVKSHLTWICRNGGNIRLWEDFILHHPPLENVEELRPLMDHMCLQGINTLAHISKWNTDGFLTNCNLGELPEHIRPLGEDLKRRLAGKAPINQYQ